jgi:hypothetical protein|tara:strand:+ start:568 stop:963 length:396 start_codon:yes stop_codon:yes gene_type:complete
MARRFHKYGKRTKDGYRSGFEGQVALNLKDCGVDFKYEQQKYDLVIPRSYTPDFVLKNGRVIEVKGYFDSEDRRLIRVFKEQHPDVDIRMCFQNPYAKLSKTAKMTYAMWCDKHNIPWCRGPHLPKRWTDV